MKKKSYMFTVLTFAMLLLPEISYSKQSWVVCGKPNCCGEVKDSKEAALADYHKLACSRGVAANFIQKPLTTKTELNNALQPSSVKSVKQINNSSSSKSIK